MSSARTTLTELPERRDRLAQRREVARKVVGQQLIDPNRLGQPFELVLAEVAVRHVADSLERRGREHDLTSVTGVRDPGSAHDVDARVALDADRRGARVEADAHTDRDVVRPFGIAHRALRFERRVDSAPRLRERGEQLVADGVHLVSRVGRERRAQEVADAPDDDGVVDLVVLLEGRSSPRRQREGM